MAAALTLDQWTDNAGKLAYRNQAFIGGKYVPAASGKTFDCISPIDGKLLTRVAACEAVDVDTAVKAARAAFESGVWSGLAPARRKKIMIRFADLMMKHRDELALLETLDMGKPIRFSTSVDVPAAANCIAWYGEAIDKGQKAAKGSILNVSVLGNCSFADSPKTGMSVIVTARENQAAADALAKELAQYLWDQRLRLVPKVMEIEEAVRRLKAVCADPTKKPLLFADCADNPGGGGRGNTVHVLKAFLEAGIDRTAFGIFNDPLLAAEAHRLGVGARFTAQLNRDETNKLSGKLTAPAEVMAVSDGEFVGRRGTMGGRKGSLGPSAWLRLDGRIDVVFIKVQDMRGVVVKSRGHFRAGFNDIFADEQILEVDAPGLTTPVLQRLPWTNLRRPIWPLDADMSWQVPSEVGVR